MPEVAGIVGAPIRSEADLIGTRVVLREAAESVGLGVVELTKLLTAASELARNILRHARGAGGVMTVRIVTDAGRTGVRATFTDQGPGIADVDLCMQDGFSTARGLGVGLPGSRRLVDAFELTSEPGQGTSVSILMWRR